MTKEGDHSDSDSHSQGHNCADHDHEHHHHGEGIPAQRGERKFRKAMEKLGLRPVAGINRVSMKKGKNDIITIDDPEVWKAADSDTGYVVYGKPNIGDMPEMGKDINDFKPMPVKTEIQAKTEAPTAPTQETAAQDTEVLSEEGITAENITMVMEYTKCTRAQAVKALRNANDDSVNAILSFSK